MKSMIHLNPYLNFAGKCEQALNFYQQCLGGELQLQKVSESPIAEHCPEGIQNHVLHGMLKADSFVLMATDMIGKEELSAGNDIAMALHSTNLELMAELFLKLSHDGEVIEHWAQRPWGDYFGVIKDQFGKRWMLNCSSGPSK